MRSPISTAALLALVFLFLVWPTSARSPPAVPSSQHLSRTTRGTGDKDGGEWDWEDDGGEEPPQENPNEAGSGEKCGRLWKRCRDGFNCTGTASEGVCEAVLAAGAPCGASFTRCVPPSSCRGSAVSRRCLIQVPLGAQCNSTTVCASGACSPVNRTAAICAVAIGRL